VVESSIILKNRRHRPIQVELWTWKTADIVVNRDGATTWSIEEAFLGYKRDLTSVGDRRTVPSGFLGRAEQL
jgi:hypothetical protein